MTHADKIGIGEAFGTDLMLQYDKNFICKINLNKPSKLGCAYGADMKTSVGHNYH